MRKTVPFLVCFGCLAFSLAVCPPVGWAQRPEDEKVREGAYEITLKTPDARKIIVDELTRDRDLDPRSLYRVRVGGYLGFDEDEWVDKIEFKVFDKPVTEIPQYKPFAALLTEINSKIWDMRERLSKYDEYGLRLMNICGKEVMPRLDNIDERIAIQLNVYRKLLLLRSLVANALDRIVRERSCVDRRQEYGRLLERFTEQLTELARDYERLSRKAITEIQAAKPGSQAEEKSEPKADSKK